MAPDVLGDESDVSESSRTHPGHGALVTGYTGPALAAPSARLPSVQMGGTLVVQDPNSQRWIQRGPEYSTVAPGNRGGFQLCVTSLFL